jgi:hypothetical protein
MRFSKQIVRSEDDEQAKNVLEQLETYSKFSFVINGIITCFLAVFGLFGNLMFVYQVSLFLE